MCELCGESEALDVCVDCEKDICDECESGYYDDEDLCKDCRAHITPEEEAEHVRLTKEYYAEDKPFVDGPIGKASEK